MTNNTLVGIVTFPAIEKFLNDFSIGLSKQTDNEFDLLIINDNLETPQLENIIADTVCISAHKKTPIENREFIIEYAIEHNYEYLIFADCDDIPCENRIGTIKKYLNVYDAVVHNMSVINKSGDIITQEFINFRKKYIEISDILKSNFVGLGNSGFRVTYLKNSLPIPSKCFAVDWWLGLNVLFSGGRMGYINQCLTLYRQYDNNMANVIEYDESDLFKEYSLKKKIYSDLAKRYPSHKIALLNELKYIEETIAFFVSENVSLINTSVIHRWWDLLNNIGKE